MGRYYSYKHHKDVDMFVGRIPDVSDTKTIIFEMDPVNKGLLGFVLPQTS